MNLQRLEYFVAVAEELHFGNAARRLHMAQPALSQQIKLFESELGVSLFDRSTRHVELTEAGRLLYPGALGLLVAAADLESLVTAYIDGARGSLRVGFVDSAAYTVLPRFINHYRAAWPDIEFTLDSMSSDQQVVALARGNIDIGICRTVGSEDGVKSMEMQRERLLIAVPSGHRLAGHARLALSDLAGERIVGFDREISRTLHAELLAHVRCVRCLIRSGHRGDGVLDDSRSRRLG